MNHAERFENLVSSTNEYELMSPYKKSSEKVVMKHKVCGNVYEVTPNKFQQGRRCNECANKSRGKKRRISPEAFRKDFKEVAGEEYELLSDYVKQKQKIRVKHKVCGHTYDVYPNNFMHQNQRCPYEPCIKERRRASQAFTNEEFLTRVKELVGGEYVFSGEYVNIVTPMSVTHVECGHTYNVTPGNFLHHNKRCPKCQFSRGEKKVEDTLNKMGIPYETQKRFDDCRLQLPLPFDFYVQYKDIHFCIEYDGEFHFDRKFRSEEEFSKQKKRDEIKDKYCLDNRIPLLRIPYTKFNEVENEIMSFVKKITLSQVD